MDTFLVRQPIFDQRRRLFAYELLFRSGPERCFRAEAAIVGRDVAGSVMVGIPLLTDGKLAFVTFSRESLLADFAFALSPDEVVIQLPESLQADCAVLAACERLKRAGFRVALGDVTEHDDAAPLLRFADFVKLDVSKPAADRAELARDLASAGIATLAQKVETWEMFGRAANCGCRYFEGGFFGRPAKLSSEPIPGFRLSYLRLVEELSHPTSMQRLERLIKQEASTAYRLLRRVNALASAFGAEAPSLHHALALLGEHEIRTSAMVWLLAEIGQEAPSEVVVASALRARACELLGAEWGDRAEASELFLVGLFSMLDAVMERPMEQVVANLPVSDAVCDALAGRPNALTAVLDGVIAYERGQWAEAVDLARAARIDEEALASSYYQALTWVNEILRQPGDGGGAGECRM